MKIRRTISLPLLLLIGLISLPAVAAVKLPAIIGDHMVLQRDQPFPIWGWDDANTEVTVGWRTEFDNGDPDFEPGDTVEFVATEFALVAVRRSQIQLWLAEGRRGAQGVGAWPVAVP